MTRLSVALTFLLLICFSAINVSAATTSSPAKAEGGRVDRTDQCDLETGSLVFLEHSNPLVATWTKSDITHVGIAVQHESATWIYEATPGHVRRVPMEQYLHELARMNQGRKRPIRAWSMRPKDDWEEESRTDLASYLDSQVGRRYSVRNYVRGKEGDGVHCGELVSAALQQTGRFPLQPHFAQDPGRLVAALASKYFEPLALTLPELVDEASWWGWTWTRWSSFPNWCRWSCYETWTFCW